MRSVLKIHGGKWYLKQWLISLFPQGYQNMTYIEACGGGASVLLQKDPSVVEIYNDADPALVEIFQALVHSPETFIEEIGKIEYSRASFEWAIQNSGAVAELVRRRMSRGGLGTHFAWSERLRGGRPGDVNAW